MAMATAASTSWNAGEAKKLAHLLRRAGFGARPQEWDEWRKKGVAGATDALLNPEKMPDQLTGVLEAICGDYVDEENLDSLRNWWIFRMVHTRRPLEEKMVLFWHNHFATANFKVDRPPWMWKQNELFRRHALGNFRTMLQALARDAAMLVWLDGRDNRNGAPNENFAREVMELFSMGVGSGYAEADIKEAARAFTGWRYDDRVKGFLYDAHLHDDGAKTIFGQTGNFHGDDVIDLICRRPATARFLATKLWRFFVHDSPSADDLKPLEEAYWKSGYDLREIMRALLTSPSFYSEAALYSKIKSPVEFAVMTMRTLDAPLSLANGIHWRVGAMGQDLFNPPNVKGWREGASWINTRTLLARVNFASEVAYEAQRRGIVPKLLKSGLVGIGEEIATPEQAVDVLWQALLPGRAPTTKTREALLKYVRDGFPTDPNAPASTSMEGGSMNGSMGAMGGSMGAMGAMEGSMGGAMSGGAAKPRLPDLRAVEAAGTEAPRKAPIKVRRAVADKLPGLLNLILSAPEYQLA
jgi:uncharacterized protein (DUF1800 family)